MAFHAFSGEDTSCEQAWRQAAPAQLRLPCWLHGGQEDTPQPGLHPKPVLPSGAGGGTQRERPCPARDGFWRSPGAVLTPRLFLGLHLTEKMWRSFSPVCDPRIPGLHFQSSLGPVVCPAALPGQPDLQHQALFEQQWVSLCLCASTNPACSCTSHVFLSQSFYAEIFSLGRCHECAEQLPESSGLTVPLGVH